MGALSWVIGFNGTIAAYYQNTVIVISGCSTIDSDTNTYFVVGKRENKKHKTIFFSVGNFKRNVIFPFKVGGWGGESGVGEGRRTLIR